MMSTKASSKKSVNFGQNSEVIYSVSTKGWTPALDEIKPTYRQPEERQVHCVAPPSTLSRPNHEGELRLVYAYVR